MNKDKSRGRKGDQDDKSEISQLTRKLKDLEDLCAKLKKSNENLKYDYDKHKAKLSKVTHKIILGFFYFFLKSYWKFNKRPIGNWRKNITQNEERWSD